MKFARHLGAQVVADFPDTLRQLVDKQGHFAVAQFLMNPALTAGEIILLGTGCGLVGGRIARRAAAVVVRTALGTLPDFGLWTPDSGLLNFRSTAPLLSSRAYNDSPLRTSTDSKPAGFKSSNTRYS